MLDLNLIRSNPEYVKEALKKREYDVDFTELLDWDARRRALLMENESLKAERNRMSKEIPVLKKQGKDATELLAKLKEMADRVKEMDEEQGALEEKIHRFVLALPNLPDEDVVAGGKENNQAVKVVGEKPVFDWEPKNHVDLCMDLGLIDYERGVKMSRQRLLAVPRRRRTAGMGASEFLYLRAPQGRIRIYAAARTI